MSVASSLSGRIFRLLCAKSAAVALSAKRDKLGTKKSLYGIVWEEEFSHLVFRIVENFQLHGFPVQKEIETSRTNLLLRRPISVLYYSVKGLSSLRD